MSRGQLGKGLGTAHGEEIEIWGYSDASYGSDEETKKGRSGYVFMGLNF